MTISLNDTLVSLSELARKLGVHDSTVGRWAGRGVRGHRLESVRVGGRRFTTQAAFERWLATINGEDGNRSVCSAVSHEHAVEAAERELEKLLSNKRAKDAPMEN